MTVCPPSATLAEMERDGDLPFLIDLLDCFVRDSAERLQAIRSAAEALDRAALARQSHSLKGSALNLGLAEIAAASADLEKRARSGAPIDLGCPIDLLANAVQEAHGSITAYRNLLFIRSLGR